MKILQINKFFYKKGGSEAYMFNLIEQLKKSGHQVIEFSMKDEKNEKSDYDKYFVDKIDFQKKEGIIKTLKKALHALYSLEAKAKLEALLEAEKPDIAHIHNFNLQLTPSILFALKKYNVPIVWTMHDYKLICPNFRLFTEGAVCERCKYHKYYNCFLHNCYNGYAMSFLAMLEMYLHKIILASYKLINVFVSPSKFLISKCQQWNIDVSGFKHIYNFVDLEKIKSAQDLGHGLIYFGRLAEEKGIMTVLEAMKSLPEINLKIVGSGPDETKIKKFVKENDLKNVALLGYRSGDELYKLISGARLVIMPSIWYENNPISILEAFALSKPVVGSDLAGIKELVVAEKTGLLFAAGSGEDFKKQIAKLYFNEQHIIEMGRNCQKFVKENCDPEVHVKKIIEVYQGLKK